MTVARNTLVCIGVLVWLSSFAFPQSRSNSGQGHSLEATISALGSDDNDLERLKALAQQPIESAGLLVAELHPVAGVRILRDEQSARKWRDTLHVVWCLRALRYLTRGLEFEASTSHMFGDSEIETNRKWFIGGGEQFAKTGTVQFFGVWMSRDSVYLAPRDAQVEIIRKWQQWYKQDAKMFQYADPKHEQSADLWYF